MTLGEYLNPMHAWRSSSDVDKVRAYTRQSFVVILVGTGLVSIIEPVSDRNVAAVALVLLCTGAGVVSVQRTPELGGLWTGERRLALALLVASAVAVTVGGWWQNGLWPAILVATPIAALIDLRWSLGAAVVVGVGAGLVGAGLPGALVLAIAVAFMAGTVRLSMWLLRIVTELDDARDAAAALSVAEERLRFSRDLHDVVGRALSAIAVTSELAATLARRGDDRAADQMDEVRALAHRSMTEARELVRGYRAVDLDSEMVGARSLLCAAGIRTDVVGETASVDARNAEQAAWVIREGVTNVLRHSRATYCRIEVDPSHIRLVNDGPNTSAGRGDGTGLTGLSERLAASGVTLVAERDDDTFTLAATFASPEATP